MNDDSKYTYRRPRLDPEAHRRIMAEIGAFGRPDPKEITETTQELRDILLDPLDEIIDIEDAGDTLAPLDSAVALEPMSEWAELGTIELNEKVLDKNLIITASRLDPAHASFDVLRTRLVQALTEKGWKRVAITSPTAGCGKSFTALNLALTLSRYDNRRTLLLDMDLRRPAVAKYLGQKTVGSIGDMLRGAVPPQGHLKRVTSGTMSLGANLVLGMNDRREDYASELFQNPQTQTVLKDIEDRYEPDIVLYDLPPALAQDDVLSFRPYFDCVLLVVGGGISTAKEIKEVHRRIGEDKPVMGVVLNMAEDYEDNTY